MTFHNPYHFVPVKPDRRPDDLAVSDFDEGKVGHVTHDRFVSETGRGQQTSPVYSGRLICRLTTEDPIVIGNKREELEDKSHRVSPFKLDGKPAIPASTLRGLISSIAEAASNSALRILENRAFSYRASRQESLQALGMIVEEPMTKQRKLLPLALPPLPWDDKNGHAEIPVEYQTMFKKPQLKVYVDGYRKKPGSQPPEVEVIVNSFLQRVNPDSYSADNQEFWYLRLAGTVSMQGTAVAVSAPHLSEGWLLGQKAATGDQPISESEYKNLPQHQQSQYIRGVLRVFGIEGRTRDIPTTKTHEIFLPYPSEMEQSPVFEAEEAVKNFLALAKDTPPFSLKGSKRSADTDPELHEVELRHGDLVFFKPDGKDHSKVGELAISSIWRSRAGGSSHDYFRQVSSELLPFHKARQQVTIAEQLFGFVEQSELLGQIQSDRAQARALASRLRFSFGLYYPNPNDPYRDDPYEGEVPLKILDSPKPPSPAFYFKPAKGKARYIAKRELNPRDYNPQGRKFYLHRYDERGMRWRTNDPGYRPQQKSWVQPLRHGRIFYFHIDFENLSQRELGLLCYAVRPADNFRHKIGMGKPLGLGKVRLDPVGLFSINRKKRYEQTSLFDADATRYHERWVLAGEEPVQWPEQYVAEKQASGMKASEFPSFDKLRQSFTDGMDQTGDKMNPDIRRALELLGDPANILRPVHTPQIAGVSGMDEEKETYRWFVVNDSGEVEAEFLEPLSESTKHLPIFPEHPWRG